MIMGNGKWNDIHQGWTGPAVYRFAGKPQWYWEVLARVEIKFQAPHAIDATSSPWPRRLDGAEAHEGPRNISQDDHSLVDFHTGVSGTITQPQ